MSLKNPYRMSLREVQIENDFESLEDMLDEYGMESVVPACCKEGCMVEPDGECEHKCPSVLRELGII